MTQAPIPSASVLPRAAALALAVFAFAAGAAAAEPAHYRIDATIDAKAQTVSADVTIALPPADVGHETAFVIGDWMKLDVVDGGLGAKVRTEPVSAPLPHLNRIVFDYANAPSAPVRLHFRYAGPLIAPGSKPSIDPAEGLELGFEDAWVPVRPDFGLRFTVDADLRGVPTDEVVVAQGEMRHTGDHLVIHRPFDDMDMPVSALTGLKQASGRDVEVYAREPDGQLETADRKDAARVIAYYSKLFGPLPRDTLPIRLVVMPRPGGSFARRGFVSVGTGREEELKKLAHIDDWMLTITISHEFAHAWWRHGDPTTEDNWLNESFAEYASLRFTEAAYGEAALKARLDEKVTPAKTAGPVIGHGRPSSRASYDKGPILLFDLDHQIGRARMDAFLSQIGRHPPHTTAELLAALSKAEGPDVAHKFEAALRAP